MRKIFFILGMLGSLLSLQAQEGQSAPQVDMKSLFVSMPDSVVPLLTQVNRADCVDFLASNMKAEVKNRFGKPSELKRLTRDYFLLQLTSRSTLAMKLLPVNDSVQVICAVRTVEGPVADSHLRFYTSDWKTLPTEDFLEEPVLESFYLAADSVPADADATVKVKADMELYRADLSAETNELTFTYTTPQYLVKDDRNRLQAFLKKEPLVYVWKDGRFVRRE